MKKLKKKVISLKSDLQCMINKNKQLSDNYVVKRIKVLPIKQQLVEHCFKESKRKSTNGLIHSKLVFAMHNDAHEKFITI